MRYPFRKKSTDKKQHHHQIDDDSSSGMVSEYVVPSTAHPDEAHVPSQEGSSRRAVEQRVENNQNSNGVQELGNVKLDKSAAIALFQGGFTQRFVDNVNEGESQRIANFESYKSSMTSQPNYLHNNRHPPTAHPYAAPRPSHGQARLVLKFNAIGNTNLNGRQSAGNVRAAALPPIGRFVVNANENHNEGELQDVGNIDINYGARYV